jgi:hypothetical protein
MEAATDERKFEFMKELGAVAFDIASASQRGESHNDIDVFMSIIIGTTCFPSNSSYFMIVHVLILVLYG